MSLLAIFMVSVSLGSCSAATNDNIVVSLAPQTQQVNNGDQFVLELWVNNSNITISAFESNFVYDSSNVNLTAIQLSGIANTAGLKTVDVSDNSISLAWMGGGITESNVNIANLTFETFNVSSNEIRLRNLDITNQGGISTMPTDEHILDASVEVLDNTPIIQEITVLPESIYEGTNTLTVSAKITDPNYANDTLCVNFSLEDTNYTMMYNDTTKAYEVKLFDMVLGVGSLTGTVVVKNTDGKTATKDTTIDVEVPDISIDSISVDKPYYSTPAKVNVSVSNNGTATLENKTTYTISIYADSELLKTVKINPLTAGEKQDILVDWTPEKASTKIIAELNFEDEYTTNEKLSKTIIVVEKPISLNLTENSSLVNTSQYFNVSIDLNKMDGFRKVCGFEGVLHFDKSIVNCEDFQFEISEGNISLKNIDIDNANGVVNYAIITNISEGINDNITVAKAKFKALKPGMSSFTLTNVSVSDVAAEFNNVELNSTKITVEGPDIVLSTSIPDTYNFGQNATLSVVVGNDGHQDIASPFKVKLYVDANDPIEKTIDSLAKNTTETLEFSWDVEARTSTLITIIADESNIIAEENESNNRVSKSVKIVEKPVYVNITKTDIDAENFNISFNVSNVEEIRKCAGYEGTLNLENLVVCDYELAGTLSNFNNETGYFGGFNFTEDKYGKFGLAEFNLRIINTSAPCSVVVKKVDLSDENSFSYGKIFVNQLITNNTIKKALKTINISADVWDKLNISNITTEEHDGYSITSIALENETLDIPVMENVSTSISKELMLKLETTTQKAEELNTEVKTTTQANESLNKIKEAMTNGQVLNNGFNVSNITSEMTTSSNVVSAKIKFVATNNTEKGYVIFRIPLSAFSLKKITITANATEHTITTEKSEFGWYKILDHNGAKELELTLLQDPEVEVEMEKTLPTSDSGSSSSSSSSRHHSSSASESITTSNLISSANIVYANLDKNYATELKSSVNKCTEGYTINDDTIIVGGPLANPLANAYMNEFAVSITNSNPGENKGVIQMITVKSEGTGIISEYTVVLLAGSDRFGTQAAVEYFKTLEEVPEEPIYVEWVNGEAKKVN
uniref:APHP domain protein n=2 Tax=Methanococcus voltae TaxID=2188 RepID=D7DTV2_METV3